MYTVIIQSKNTSECFEEHYPLFASSVESGKVATCLWTESGASVETALPELEGLVGFKKSWRAVIVSTELEQPDNTLGPLSENPFDYAQQSLAEGDCSAQPFVRVENGVLVDDSPPLVRLTHLLGGFPEPEIEYSAIEKVEVAVSEKEERQERSHLPLQVELIASNEGGATTYREAVAKWRHDNPLNVVAPTEIIIVKVRRSSDCTEYPKAKASWNKKNELDSSSFWKRNAYPHKCRFLTYELEGVGSIQLKRSFFKMWTAVLLLARNEVSSSVLQAFRLYRLDASIDSDEIEIALQQMMNRLNFASYRLQRSIAEEERKDTEENADRIPEYRLGCDVVFRDAESEESVSYDKRWFKLTGGVDSSDCALWETYNLNVRERMTKLSRQVDRELDVAASNLREKAGYSEVEVEELSAYKVQDMSFELDDIYENVLAERGDLPEGMSSTNMALDEANKDVRARMKSRVTKRDALTVAAYMVVTSALGCAVALIGGGPVRNGLTRVLAFVVIIAVGAGAILISLIQQRQELRHAIDAYRRIFQSFLLGLSRAATSFSAFLGDIASHMNGRSYLDILLRRKDLHDGISDERRRQLATIDDFSTRVLRWAEALYVKIDARSTDVFDDENWFGPIGFDALFVFDEDHDYQVEINNTGSFVSSPYRFVDRLTIEREEIFDD